MLAELQYTRVENQFKSIGLKKKRRKKTNMTNKDNAMSAWSSETTG